MDVDRMRDQLSEVSELGGAELSGNGTVGLVTSQLHENKALSFALVRMASAQVAVAFLALCGADRRAKKQLRSRFVCTRTWFASCLRLLRASLSLPVHARALLALCS